MGQQGEDGKRQTGNTKEGDLGGGWWFDDMTKK